VTLAALDDVRNWAGGTRSLSPVSERLGARPEGTSPHELLQHRCVSYRHDSGEIYRSELGKGDQCVVVAVQWATLITNDIGLSTRAAIDGVVSRRCALGESHRARCPIGADRRSAGAEGFGARGLLGSTGHGAHRRRRPLFGTVV
jgi:hypothetical protein